MRIVRLTRLNGDPIYVNSNSILYFSREKLKDQSFVTFIRLGYEDKNWDFQVTEDPEYIMYSINHNYNEAFDNPTVSPY